VGLADDGMRVRDTAWLRAILFEQHRNRFYRQAANTRCSRPPAAREIDAILLSSGAAGLGGG